MITKLMERMSSWAAERFARSGLAEHYCDKIRATQLQETIKLARYSSVAPIFVALAFVFLFWDTPQRGYVVLLCVMVAVPTTIAIGLAERFARLRVFSARGVTIGKYVANTLALIVGCAWATMPIVLFAPSDANHRLVVVGSIIGVLADVFVLGPIFQVCLLFATPIVIGGFVGLLRSGEPIAFMLSIMLAIYAIFIAGSCKFMSELSALRITDRVRVGEQKETIDLLLRNFEQTTSDWLWETDRSRRLRNVSARLAQAARKPASALQRTLFEDILIGPNAAAIGRGIKDVLEDMGARRPFQDRVVEIPDAEGPIYWQLSGRPMIDDLGRFTGYKGVCADVTNARRAQLKLAQLANFDALTGLMNRSYFLQCCATFPLGSRPGAMLYIDLDGFKAINDTAGHAAGDLLLQDVAHRLSAKMPQHALLGRLGGDEFAVFLEVADANEASALAFLLIDIVSAPYTINDVEVGIGASVGIALASETATLPAELLINADLALYRAKAQGRGRALMFGPEFELSLIVQREFENDLRLALPRGEFELHYQPLMDTSTGCVVCFEALIRWNRGPRGFVPPSDFIATAEAIGIITHLGRWVLTHGCKTAASWPDHIRLAVNVSPQHFRRRDFVKDVQLALSLSRLDPRRLEIEITEGVFLDASQTAVDNLQALRDLGVAIALDDFGSGYSSMGYLTQFKVDKIKIDQSFVRQIVERKENRAIVHAMLSLAHDLSIQVTAEGVETVEQAIALRARGCDSMQGYLFSKPKPESEVLTMIDSAAANYREAFAVMLQLQGEAKSSGAGSALTPMSPAAKTNSRLVHTRRLEG